MRKILSLLMVTLFSASLFAATYTVAGSSDVLFGKTWTPGETANDMTLVSGLYTFAKTDVVLGAGTVEFKVCQDHAWTNCWPSSNYQLSIPTSGKYDVTITFNESSKAVNATATKKEDVVVIPSIAMHGNFTGSWTDTENFTLADNKETATLKLTMAAGNYEFGMRIGGAGNWTSNGAAFTRENPSAVVNSGSGNLTLAADATGEYTFTWTYASNTLTVTYPAPPSPEEIVHFYIAGEGKGLSWESTDWKEVKGADSFDLDLAAGSYKLKVVTLNNEWLGFDNLSPKTAIDEGLSKDNDGNIAFTLEQGGKVTVTYFVQNNDTTFTLSGDFKVCHDGPYGLYVEGKDRQDTIAAIKQDGTDGDGRVQYLAFVNLNKGDSISVMNISCGDIFLPTIEQYGIGSHFKVGTNFAVIDTTGCFDLYIKLKMDDNTLYAGAGICPEDTIRYSVVGQGDILGNWDTAIGSKQDTLVLDLKAGNYKMKLFFGDYSKDEDKAQPDMWLGFEQMTDTAAGLETDKDKNICFELKEDGVVRVVYGFDQNNKRVFKLIGTFVEHTDRYFLVGTMTKWADNAVELLPLEEKADSLGAVLALEADSLYEFKVVHVHWNDTVWFGLGNEMAKMEFGNSKGWWIYKSTDTENTANVGLQTTDEAEYPVVLKVEDDHLVVSIDIPARYYAKYNVGDDWAWSQMEEKEGKWIADNVVYRGGGANAYFKEDNDNAWYFNETGESPAFKAWEAYEGLALLDTVQLIFNPADTTMAVELIGKYIYIEPAYQIAGTWDMDGENWIIHDLVVALDEETASYAVELTAGEYLFKIVKGDKWLSKANGEDPFGLHRDFPGVAGVVDENEANLKLTADVDGLYTFTWTFANDSIGIAFPEKPAPEAHYGLLINGQFHGATKNEEYQGEGEEWVITVSMQKEDKFQVYNKKDEVGWFVKLDENEGNYTNFDMDGDFYVVKASGSYKIFIKLIYGNDNLWIVFDGDPSGCENLSDEIKATKIIRNGNIYILKNGNLYNITGQTVK